MGGGTGLVKQSEPARRGGDMMKRLARFTIWALVAVAVFAVFVKLTDRALYQLDYKLCKQVPVEVRGADDCHDRMQP